MIEGLVVVLAVAALLAATYGVAATVLRHLPAGTVRLPGGPIPERWVGILERNVPLARSLSSAERDRLLRLVALFLRDKHFEGAGGLTVTEEMRVTIAAAACLLVLELEGPCYPKLRTVLVYPESFVPKYAGLPATGQIAPVPVPLMGESWRDGVVVLSWEDVVRGAREPGPHENVVLHEFAHQLDQEDGAGDGTPVLSGGSIRTWGRVLSGEYERLRRDAAADRPSVLDAYGAKDQAEFFAVATEAFFEQPHALERDHAELYAELRQFYGQDPARRVPPPPPPPTRTPIPSRGGVTRAPARLIDVSHTIEHGMVTYPGLLTPTIADWLARDASGARYAPGTTFQIGRIDMLANTGTYIDAPFHRYEGGNDIADYPLAAVADLEGIVIRAAQRAGNERALDRAVFRGHDVAGKAVLVHTGWDVHWRTERYGSGHPFLTRAAAEHLVAARAALVGIDSLNIDDAADGTRPVHTILLGAGIPVVEHLCNLGELPDSGFRFFAAPVKVRGMGSFPVRAFAVLGG